jgi:hypothetical protein
MTPTTRTAAAILARLENETRLRRIRDHRLNEVARHARELLRIVEGYPPYDEEPSAVVAQPQAPLPATQLILLIRAHRAQFGSDLVTARSAINGGWRPQSRPAETESESLVQAVAREIAERIVGHEWATIPTDLLAWRSAGRPQPCPSAFRDEIVECAESVIALIQKGSDHAQRFILGSFLTFVGLVGIPELTRGHYWFGAIFTVQTVLGVILMWAAFQKRRTGAAAETARHQPESREREG